MRNRIKTIRQNENLTQEEFGEKVGLNRDIIFNIESGRKILRSEYIEDICSTFNINAEWMIYGRGPIYKTSDKSKLLSDNLSKLSESDLLRDAMSDLSKLDQDELEAVYNLIQFLSKRKRDQL